MSDTCCTYVSLTADKDPDETSTNFYELHRKVVAEAFWTAEVEAELREWSEVGYLFTTAATRENIMDVIDAERATKSYAHNLCSEACQKRGMYKHK